jgi:peptidyl-dipeptidase A
LKTDKDADYSDKRIGEFLVKEIFHPGRKYEWEELIKKATQEPLTARYFAEQFCEA